ncbi:MAG: LPS export ABC transporter periplasmic protein LptC [Desulfomicrobium sp.]|jgi:LPS export ABC transporter protein LptC|nr:LPS export ABC transporter periplasmic protein LptC [Desulfomicrobium sp.]NLV97249.1 LPS export ABC transporter periplasmic protein LptC [Desulfovibrionales bacterium]
MKHVLSGGLALILLIGLFLLGKYVLWPERLQRSIPQDISVDLSLEGITLNQGRDGVKLWNLQAKSANYAETEDNLVLDSPTITYWGNDTIPVYVDAPHGQVWQKKDQARMWGGVHIKRDEYDLCSQTLDYDGASHTLTLREDVEMTGPAIQATSNTMIYYLETGDVDAAGNVQVILN